LWKTQTTNTRTGADTWRCKECHGWDYKGVDGAYGAGSHQTGFPGIRDAASMSSEDLTAWLTGAKNSDHDFSPVLDEAYINALVTFVQKETLDSAAYINADKTVNGDAARGKVKFEKTCAACHGTDGKKINFGNDAEPEFVGTLAADNPWEFFHKVSFGQPGEPMPTGIGLGYTMDDRANLAAYAQTLPTK
jgi:thiosulfate dehydrogenase